MPDCSILGCKNNSRRKNLKNGGVSYHRFPKDGSVKEKWIDATGRVNWMPTKSSTICSEHFLKDDIVLSNKGYRYTIDTAVPSIKIVKFFGQLENDNLATVSSSKRQSGSESSEKTQPKKKSQLHEGLVETPLFEQHFCSAQFDGKTVQNKDVTGGSDCSNDNLATVSSSKRQSGSESSEETQPKKKSQLHEGFVKTPQFEFCSVQFEGDTVQNKDDTGGSNCSAPRKKLKDQLRFCQGKIVKQGLKIKRLQSRNRRLNKKINNIDEVLVRLEDKMVMAIEYLVGLKNTNLEVQELVNCCHNEIRCARLSSQAYHIPTRTSRNFESPKTAIRQGVLSCFEIKNESI